MDQNCTTCQIDEPVAARVMTKAESCEVPNENPLEQPCAPMAATAPTPAACVAIPIPGISHTPADSCALWELTQGPEAGYFSDLIGENLNIGGADVNVHKLLGVHEQDGLQDLTGLGSAVSGGSHPNFIASNAFDKLVTEWRSVQSGSDVQTHAYIGYDFGPILLDNTRRRYGIETYIKHDVAAFRIKQSCYQQNRATKVRVERSMDGVKWFGVAIVALDDCDGLVSVSFNKSVPSRWWRLRPLAFNGGPEDYWGVQALQLIEHEATNISNIQDRILLENRDRDYNEFAIKMKCAYTPVDVVANAAKFGFMGEDSYIIEVSFAQTVSRLGRPFVIGDILQLPAETQYTPMLKPVLKYLEVTDVAWSTNGYTPTWVPTMQRLICSPAVASQETQKIFGKLTRDIDSSGLFDNDDGTATNYQDYSDISQTIEADANTAVPQDGTDYANVPKLSEELLAFGDKHNLNLNTRFNRNRLPSGIDAMPPNGLPYTEGDTRPTKPKDGDYHRLTYVSSGKNIPARLYRYSSLKKDWVYLETDHRFEAKEPKSRIEEFKTGRSIGKSVSPKNIDEELS